MLSVTQELITPDKWIAFSSLKYMTKANEKQHMNLWHLLMSKHKDLLCSPKLNKTSSSSDMLRCDSRNTRDTKM